MNGQQVNWDEIDKELGLAKPAVDWDEVDRQLGLSKTAVDWAEVDKQLGLAPEKKPKSVNLMQVIGSALLAGDPRSVLYPARFAEEMAEPVGGEGTIGEAGKIGVNMLVQMGLKAFGTAGQLAYAVAQGAGTVPIAGLQIGKFKAEKTFEQVDPFRKKWNTFIEEKLTPFPGAEQPTGEYAEAPKNWKAYFKDPKRALQTVATQGPLMAGLVGSYLVNPIFGIIMMGAVEATDTQQAIDQFEARTGQPVPTGYKILAPIVVGSINAALEKTGIDKILKVAKVPGLKAKIAQGLISMFTEGSTEALQEVTQILAEKGYNPNVDWKRVGAAAYGGILLSFGGSVMTGTAGAIKEKAIKKTVMEYIELGQDIPTPEIGRLVEAIKAEAEKTAMPMNITSDFTKMAKQYGVTEPLAEEARKYNDIAKRIEKEFPDVNVFVGGSRAIGKEKFGSDLDIVLRQEPKAGEIKRISEILKKEYGVTDSGYFIDKGLKGLKVEFHIGEPKKGAIPIKDFYNQATQAKPVPAQQMYSGSPSIKTEKLHHTLLPFGEGQERISMHAAKIKEKLGLIGNLKDLTLEERAELLTYNQMNREGKIALATEYVLQNEQRAWDVLYNRRIPPKDIPVVAIGIAMENLAVDNWKIASDLTSLRGTRYGQENSLFAEADPHSPVKYLNQIVQSRVEAMGGKSEVAAKRTHEMNSIQKEINKGISSKTAWDSFIRSIEC